MKTFAGMPNLAKDSQLLVYFQHVAGGHSLERGKQEFTETAGLTSVRILVFLADVDCYQVNPLQLLSAVARRSTRSKLSLPYRYRVQEPRNRVWK